MPGNFSYSYPGTGLGLQAASVATFLYSNGEYSWLPNVQCMQVQWREGKTPRTAQFRYILDSSGLTNFPSQFEQLWPLNISGGNQSYTVISGSRLVVFVQTPDGSNWIVFDGFPRLPQTDYGDSQQQVTFMAMGVETRCSDIPIQGRYQRDIVALTNVGEVEVRRTDVPSKFNPTDSIHPYGLPNCTADGTDINNADPTVSYPVFTDELSNNEANPFSPSFWTLGKAVRYILGAYNSDTSPTGLPRKTPLVTNPDFTQTDVLLDNYAPLAGQAFFDPQDPQTFTTNPIILREIDITNMPWPDALEQLLGFYNFGFRWRLSTNSDLEPQTNIDIYRKDPGNNVTPKDLFLQASNVPQPQDPFLQLPPIATFDPAQTNIGNMSASFDYHGVANEFRIETHPVKYEASFILAPGFTPQVGDEVAPARNQFMKENLDTSSQIIRDKYRLYVFDETGIGHWNIITQMFVTGKPTDLSLLFPPDGNGDPTYIVRLRQCANRLITTDTYGEKYKSQLAFTRNMVNGAPTFPSIILPTIPPIPTPPGVIEDNSDLGLHSWSDLPWQPIPQGSWELEDDRIGIRFTGQSPEEIHVGKYAGANPQEPSDVLKGITSVANPVSNAVGQPVRSMPFVLRLTTVIEGDRGLNIIARKRQASPLANTVMRRLDAKDVFQKQVITYSSAFWDIADNNLTPMGDASQFDAPYFDDDNNIVARDDTNAAQAYANQMRTAHEMPSLPMAITINYFTAAYLVGDRVDQIQGRNVSLQTNAGAEQGEAPAYPFVVGVTWTFEGDTQRTVLSLTDHRTSPMPLAWSGRRPGKG